MANDIQPGDLVVCVHQGPISGTDRGVAKLLVLGGVYTVTGLFLSRRGVPSVLLAEARSDSETGGYYMSRFRKITPYAERFATELRECLPSKEPVLATPVRAGRDEREETP